MAIRAPGPLEIRVILRGAARDGGRLYYNRPFVNLTVAEAIRRLDTAPLALGGLPHDFFTVEPYFLNGKEVQKSSREVLKYGDVLDCNDP